MAIRFRIKGIDFEVDAAVDAVALVNAFVEDRDKPEQVAVAGTDVVLVKEETPKRHYAPAGSGACDECGKIYDKKRYDQRFCSKECRDKNERVRGYPKKAKLPPTPKKFGKGEPNGLYCLECDKPLTGGQKFFCTTGHAGRYYLYHKGEVLTKLTQPRNGKVTTSHIKPITVVAGVGIRK